MDNKTLETRTRTPIGRTPITQQRFYSVGIIGTGRDLNSVGWQVAQQLCAASPVASVHLYNKSIKGAENLKELLDSTVIPHRADKTRPSVKVYEFREDIVSERPDAMFISFDATPKRLLEEHGVQNWKELVAKGIINRSDFLRYNTLAIAGCAKSFRGYDKKVIINTNPVDVMAYIFLAVSQMPVHLVAGFNEADSDRLRRIILEIINKEGGNNLVGIRDIKGFVVGPHNENVVPVFSQARILGKMFYDLEREVPYLSADKIRKRVAGEAGRWFRMLGSTSPELVFSYAKTIEAAALGGNFRLNNNSYPTMSVYVPQLQTCTGWPVAIADGFRGMNVRLDDDETRRFHAAAEITKMDIAAAQKIFREHTD